MFFMTVSIADEEIAGIGAEPDRLSQNQHRIEPRHTVADDHRRTHKTHHPESDGKTRLPVPGGIDPLINEAQREDGLPERPEDKQCKRHLLVPEKGIDECARMTGDGNERRNGRSDQHEACQTGNLSVDPLDIQIPEIHVIGDELPEDDGKVLAQPSVEEQQPRTGQRTDPVGRWRDDPVGALGEHPLYHDPRREEELRQEADGINPPHDLTDCFDRPGS